MSSTHYALNGTSGNAYSPALVTAATGTAKGDGDGDGGELYLYHNDENAHDGVHRWALHGAAQLRLAASTAVRR